MSWLIKPDTVEGNKLDKACVLGEVLIVLIRNKKVKIM